MKDSPYMPTTEKGVVQGDTRDLPNRGTTTGTVGLGEPYGADIGANAINRKGKIGDAGSDPRDMVMPKGDEDRFSASTHSSPDSGGRSFSADSDPIDKTRSDQKPGL